MDDIIEALKDDHVYETIRDYAFLSRLNTLSDEQSNRYATILSEAIENNTLDFLINEVEHVISHELGFIDMEGTKNDQALLREYLGLDTDRVNASIHERTRGEVGVT